jgi:hypothetical protein
MKITTKPQQGVKDVKYNIKYVPNGIPFCKIVSYRISAVQSYDVLPQSYIYNGYYTQSVYPSGSKY